MKATGSLRIGRCVDGYVLRIEGRGGVRESSTLRDYVQTCLQQNGTRVVLDLNECDYLDSTFLGCIVGLYKRFGEDEPGRFLVAADHLTCVRLLALTKVDQFLRLIDVAPDLVEPMRPVVMPTLTTRDMGRHVVDCHQLLAQLGGPEAGAFAKIAEQLGRELEQSSLADPPRDRRLR
jgi:anti-anti-sigma factor